LDRVYTLLLAIRANVGHRREMSRLQTWRHSLLVTAALVLILAATLALISGGGVSAPASPPATDAGVPAVSPANRQFEQAIAAAAQVLPPSPSEIGTPLMRLLLAAFLGLAISFRGRRRSEFQVVHTNMILAFSGALMMMIVGSDLARAFGLVGASSIVRYRTPVHDPKALASLFVSMGAGIAVGVGLLELAIAATILVILIEFALEHGGRWLSYRSERSYELNLETDTPEETLMGVRKILNAERINHTLIDYEAARKSENVKLSLAIGLPEGADTEKLTLQILGAGARSVSWRLAKD